MSNEQAGNIEGDERMDFFSLKEWKNAEREKNHSSIVMVIHKEKVRDGYITADLLKDRAVSYQFNLDEDIRFGNEKSAHSAGSGFFYKISADQKYGIVITAAHNVVKSPNKADDFLFIHGVFKKDRTEHQREGDIPVEDHQIFEPVPGHNRYYLSELGSDLAVILVRRRAEQPANDQSKVHSVKKFAGKLEENAPIYSMGHGLGLPLKVSLEGEIERIEEKVPYFEAKLPLLGGNSGSPIFDEETDECIGMYIRGVKKFILDDKRGTLVIKAEENSYQGHECQKWENIIVAYNNLIDSGQFSEEYLPFIEELRREREAGF